MPIPKELEGIVHSNFEFLDIGIARPDSYLYAKTQYPERNYPTIVLGPSAGKISYSVRINDNRKNKLCNINSRRIGVIDISLDNGDFYQIHQYSGTMPDLKYEKIGRKDLEIPTR